VSAKDSESSNSKNSADVKDLTIADSEKVQFANNDSGEIMSAKVENEDNSVNDKDSKISKGTQNEDSVLQSKDTKNIIQ